MQMHYTFHDCDNHLKSKMRVYWKKELPRFERLLQHFPDQLSEMWLTVRRVSRPERFETKVVVELPTQTLVVEHNAESWMESFGKAADRLGLRIKRHKEKLRREWAMRRRRRRREELIAARPELARDHNQSRRREFFSLFGPLLDNLRRQARRELRLLESEGEIRRNEWTAQDVVDEVLVRTWERFASIPDHTTLDVWARAILHEVLAELVSGDYRMSLDTPLPDPTEPAEDDDYDSFFLDHELATLADVLPDHEDTATWDTFERDEQRRRLEQALAKLAPGRRQAFILHALEGFDLAEVAMILDREEQDVAADLEAGRATLRREIANSRRSDPSSIKA